MKRNLLFCLLFLSLSSGLSAQAAFGWDELAAGLLTERASDFSFDEDGDSRLIANDIEPIYRHSFRAGYLWFDTNTRHAVPLSAGGPQQAATLSPDGTRAAFVRDNNLFYVTLADRREVQVTRDGRAGEVINGVPDWVYEEEFSFARAYEWSPDSRRIAWMRFDESAVREVSMNRFDGQLYPSVYTYKYPKAGETNSTVGVHVYDLESGERLTVDLGAETDQYIPRIRFTPDGRLAVYRLNRAQNRFEVLLADPATGATRVIYEETDERYVERVDDQTIVFLADGDRFVVRSERDGWFHLYLYSIERGFLNQITCGEWEVIRLVGVDESIQRVYYLSTESSPLGRNLYRARLDGDAKERLTRGEGTHEVEFNAGLTQFVDRYSTLTTPTLVTLNDASGHRLRVLEDNADLQKRLKALAVPRKEFFTFTTPEGVTLNGWMLRPPGFTETERYPVLMTQYSGPGSQSVTDSWGVGWEDVLVQRGYLVVCVDGRGTGGRGEAFRKCTYRQLGCYETDDQIAAARWLADLPYVDASRIGIYGWSYGGFMALNAILKGADVFRAAIAVAPVTNWRYYDTIYTELYNGLPADNPAGYDDNSPIFFADRLAGRLLVAHGTADDNVHVQNTYELVNRLVAADKDFEMYIYPDRNHGMAPGARNHLMQRCIEFVLNNL